jgi:hypothetical protein
VDRGRGPPFRRLAPGAVTVKFLRHLSAVVLAVAVIVGLGMLWAHTSGGGTGTGIRVQSDNGFHLANTSDLIRTCVVEAVLAAVVITVSATRRRRRRVRRTTAARLLRSSAG